MLNMLIFFGDPNGVLGENVVFVNIYAKVPPEPTYLTYLAFPGVFA